MSFTKQLKHLHTLDLSSLLPNRTPPWSPDQNEVLEDLYDGEDSTLHRRWRDHVQEFQLYMLSVTMELKKDLPELRRFWWITHTERMDGKKIHRRQDISERNSSSRTELSRSLEFEIVRRCGESRVHSSRRNLSLVLQTLTDLPSLLIYLPAEKPG